MTVQDWDSKTSMTIDTVVYIRITAGMSNAPIAVDVLGNCAYTKHSFGSCSTLTPVKGDSGLEVVAQRLGPQNRHYKFGTSEDLRGSACLAAILMPHLQMLLL